MGYVIRLLNVNILKGISGDQNMNHYTTLVRNDPMNISFSQRQVLNKPQQHNSQHESFYENVSHFQQAPTESAKIRRKNASLKTNEIMRDSSNAVERFENVFNGILNVGVNDSFSTRCRIDSEDSGKGKSVRNSYENEESKSGRPISFQPEHLNSIINKRRRVRLVSEPAYEHMYTQYISPKPRKLFQPSSLAPATLLADRHSSPRHNLISSQPTTPNRYDKVFFKFPDPGMAAPTVSEYISAVPSYATLPKQQNLSMKKKSQMHVQGVYPMPSKNMAIPNNFNKSQIPVTVFTGPRNTSASLPNRYPSMQVRGSHANVMHTDRRRHLSCGPPSYQELKIGERLVTKATVKRNSSTASSHSSKKFTPPPAYDAKLV